RGALATRRDRGRGRHPPGGGADERARPVQQHRVRGRPRAVHGVPAHRSGRADGSALRATARGRPPRDRIGLVVIGPVLETEGLSKRFEGLVAVDAVDLRIDADEIRGVVGPNGAGKTTMFNLVSGLYRVSGGRIRLRGRDVTEAAPHLRAAAGLGRTYQTPQIFPDLSVFDNVAVGLGAIRPPSLRDALLGRRRDWDQMRTRVEETLDFLGLPAGGAAAAGARAFGGERRPG